MIDEVIETDDVVTTDDIVSDEIVVIEEEKQPVSLIQDLEEFFKSYLVDTSDGFIQIFQSFTYGEMVISFLLLVLVLLYGFKWIWEVLF